MGTVLITGSSSGLGLATAVELAKRGERVFASMRDTSRSGNLKKVASALGVEVEVIELDVTDSASVSSAVGQVLSRSGRIDVLVNNAGLASLGPLEFTTDDEVQRLFDTNVFGPLRVIRAVLPSMRARKQGRIVNISSLASHPRLGLRLWGIYTASKAAFSALTLELCKEVASLGIEVVLLEGGLQNETPMTNALGQSGADLQPESSPYGTLERIVQAQLKSAGYMDKRAPAASVAAVMIADACTVENVPLRFPPEAQVPGEVCDRLSDNQFLRLASLDSSPALYESAPPYWRFNI